MKVIESYIQHYFGISGQGLSEIGDLFENTSLGKHDFLLKREQYARSIHFVKSGYLRIYRTDVTGEKEITQWISSQGTFVTDLSSFVFDTPSRWNIQALSDCELYTISKEKYNSIGEYVRDWEKIDKLFIAKCFITLEERVFNQLSMTAEEKVKHLLAINSEIFLNVPLQYIASMLGMTPETLSRIRKKMAS